MKTTIVVLLSCVALAAAFAVDTQESLGVPLPRNEGCASTCLWAGIYNVPSFQNCNRYLHCIHGFLFELECPIGEVFDHVTLLCQHPSEGRCVLDGPVASRK